MQTLVIVSQFYVGGGIRNRLFSRGVDHTVYTFILQCAEEGFRHRVVVTNTGASDGLADAEHSQSVRELGGHVVTTTIQVENRILRDISSRPCE